MEPYWSTHFMLPDQEHPYAQAIGEALESARESVAFLVGCEPFEIVFTSGGTEANNLALKGAVEAARGRGQGRRRLVTLATEMDRTLFFDFLPLELGEVKGFKSRFHQCKHSRNLFLVPRGRRLIIGEAVFEHHGPAVRVFIGKADIDLSQLQQAVTGITALCL